MTSLFTDCVYVAGPDGQIKELKQKVIEQAAVIEKLREALWWLCDSATGSDLQKIQEALAIPTDSAQVLQEWLDAALGIPVVNYSKSYGLAWTEYGMRIDSTDPMPLYRKPVLK